MNYKASYGARTIADNEEGIKEVFLKRDYLHTLSLTDNVYRKHNCSLTEQSPL